MAVGVACSDLAASVSKLWPSLLGTLRYRRFRAETPMTDTGTVFWTLRKDDHRLECSVERLPRGLHVHMAVNGDTPYRSRTCNTSDELLSWTADEHARCLAEGWS